MQMQFTTRDGRPYVRQLIKFTIISGPKKGLEFGFKCSMKHKNNFPSALIPDDPTPYRIVKQIAPDHYEIEPTGLC